MTLRKKSQENSQISVHDQKVQRKDECYIPKTFSKCHD